jgi:hypothetical protein
VRLRRAQIYAEDLLGGRSFRRELNLIAVGADDHYDRRGSQQPSDNDRRDYPLPLRPHGHDYDSPPQAVSRSISLCAYCPLPLELNGSLVLPFPQRFGVFFRRAHHRPIHHKSNGRVCVIETREATNQAAIRQVEVPGDADEKFTAVGISQSRDERRWQDRVVAHDDPGVGVVPDWSRSRRRSGSGARGCITSILNIVLHAESAILIFEHTFDTRAL